jgi:hypothetical protein
MSGSGSEADANKSDAEDEKDIDEDENAPAEAIKRLEASFLNIKDNHRKYEIKPNLINADYCMKRLLRNVSEPEDFNSDYVYGEDAEYMVYSEKQVQIRYLIQFKNK